MPNNVINEIKFKGLNQEQKENIKKHVINKNNNVDFSILVPPPLNIWMGSCGREHTDFFKKTWYEWNVENWGTKWNAYESKLQDKDDEFLIICQTAWYTPHPWLAALLNKFNLSFEVISMSEGEDRAWFEKYTFDIENETGRINWKRVEADEEQEDRADMLLRSNYEKS